MTTATASTIRKKPALMATMVGAIGVVFGDIGTSPLYAVKETFGGHHPLEVSPANILGVLSLVFWAITLLVSLKYVALIMRADNRGEGGILALMALLPQRFRDARTGREHTLLLLVLIGAFTHFYVVFESVAALMVLALWRPRQRLLMVASAVAVLAIAFLYLKLFVATHSQIVMGNYWIQNTLAWYSFELKFAAFYAFGPLGRLLIAFGVAAVIVRLLWPGLDRKALGRFPIDPVTSLVIGVPAIVLMAAVSSSLLVAPNFANRYLLVCSPFLWGICARLYDVAVEGAPRFFRLVVNLVLAAGVLGMASFVTARVKGSDLTVTWSEPFRVSADWIRSRPECRGQMVPVIANDQRAWYKPGYAEDIYNNAYARYLKGFAQPELVFGHDIVPGPLPDAIVIRR